MRHRRSAPIALAAVAFLAAACGSSSTSPAASGSPTAAATSSHTASSTASAGAVVKTEKIGHAIVLTNAEGRTLYWFAPDTSTKSDCTGACAKAWPPVKGPVTGAGVTGKFGTITRSDGSVQATYDGHPLYTYIADTAAGQDRGSKVSHGVWHVVTVSGTATPASSPS